jgi:ATP-dependent helicase/nuclease subunit A
MTTARAESEPRFTIEQSRAIQTRQVSVALSAGAGCGKTFVLTERFLAYFDRRDRPAAQPSDLGRAVAITFTERAAREMRDRIRRKCHDRLMTAEPQDAPYWADLLRGLDNARISTIHSFCASLLRSRAVEAGIDPQFEVLEQAQADTLLSEVIDDELRRLLAEREPVAFEMATRFDLALLREMLRTLVLDCTSDQFASWLQISPDQQVACWEACFRERVLGAVVRQVSESAAARTILSIIREHVPDHGAMRSRCEVLLVQLLAIASAADSRAIQSHLDEIQTNARVQGGGGAKAWESPEVYAAFRDAATELRKRVDEARPFATFDPRAAREAAEIGGQLLAMAGGVHRRFARNKQELNVLDFNDLLSGARQLLADPAHRELRTRLASQIDLLLVDEFQDTDPLQVELVRALCDEDIAGGKLFFVGDYKQSIYRFRGADPHVFRSLRDRTPEQGRQKLTLNFRSQPAILQFVNGLFWHDLGDDYEALRPERPQVSPTPAVEFLWARGADDTKENKETQRRREADWIARRVRALIDGQQPIVCGASVEAGRPAARAAQPGDFAILFRALSNVEIYEEALRRHGIDYYLVGGHAFYAQQEIFDLLNLLRTLNSRADLVSLAGVLRSGFFSLADETIFWLSGHPEGLASGLFAAEHPAEIPPEQSERARFAATTLAQLRQCKDRLRICDLIDEALARTGYDAVLLNEFLGERKLANLRKLVEQARSFERGDFFGLSDFIAQLALFVARQPEEPLAATQAEDTNVVRLMTIHQSKGLEFPIVIVADVDRRRHDASAPVHFDAELGPLVRLPETVRGKAPPGGYELWRFLEKSQEAAELHRLLYVATTRAADYLILSSNITRLEAAEGPWMELLARRFDLASGRLIGSLPRDEPRPEVRVTSEEPPLPRSGRSRSKKVDLDQVVDNVMAASRVFQPGRRPIDLVEPDWSARRQYSFSRLAGTLHRHREPTEPIDSDEAAPVDARGLGTLVHAVLAAMEFNQPIDLPNLVKLHALRHLSEDSADAKEALEMIERFAASPRARELAAAKESHAEVEFLLRWPPDELPRNQAVEHQVLVRGYLDRLYQDSAGRWHVLDFKTNRVRGGEVAQQAAAYEMQMLVYALATERILGSAPASLTLHFLRSGAEHPFAWNEAARQRTIDLVNQGVAAVAQGPGPTP